MRVRIMLAAALVCASAAVNAQKRFTMTPEDWAVQDRAIRLGSSYVGGVTSKVPEIIIDSGALRLVGRSDMTPGGKSMDVAATVRGALRGVGRCEGGCRVSAEGDTAAPGVAQVTTAEVHGRTGGVHVAGTAVCPGCGARVSAARGPDYQEVSGTSPDGRLLLPLTRGEVRDPVAKAMAADRADDRQAAALARTGVIRFSPALHSARQINDVQPPYVQPPQTGRKGGSVIGQPRCFTEHPECPTCRAMGWKVGSSASDDPRETCPTCGGQGFLLCPECVQFNQHLVERDRLLDSLPRGQRVKHVQDELRQLISGKPGKN